MKRPKNCIFTFFIQQNNNADFCIEVQTTKDNIIILNNKSDHAIFRSRIPFLFHEVVRRTRVISTCLPIFTQI